VELPAFLPDATMGYVRAVDSSDLERCGIQALVMNVFHLMQRPGSTTVQALGGLHQMSGWSQPILTDSGGFQAYSLIRQNPKYGHLSDRGIVFRPEGSKRKINLTPEKSIQLQLGYGTDIAVCLDDCTHVDAPLDVQRESVRRTVAWAKRCKDEYRRLVEEKGLAERERPLIFAVIQGGGSLDLRQACTEELLAIGFDGFGYGGWPLDSEGNLLTEIFAFLRELVPGQFPMHALGVGHPVYIATCTALGYDTFDSALPTRDARHGRLYTFAEEAYTSDGSLNGDWFRFVYINDEKHIKANAPISPHCDCLACIRYTRGYLHHLYKTGDSLYLRLATVHNLRFMARLMDRLRRTHHG
jgi:queuine tRNA-ribosyltransferase